MLNLKVDQSSSEQKQSHSQQQPVDAPISSMEVLSADQGATPKEPSTVGQKPSADPQSHVPTPDACDSSAKLKKTSQRKTEANRRNSRRSTGPRDTSITRLNALRHGFKSKGLNIFDNWGLYEKELDQLKSQYAPSGPISEFLVERVALDLTRARRGAAWEAEYINLMIDTDAGLCGANIHDHTMKERLAPLFKLLQRYDAEATNRIFRSLRQLALIREQEPVAPRGVSETDSRPDFLDESLEPELPEPGDASVNN